VHTPQNKPMSPSPAHTRWWWLCSVIATACALSGCEAIALTAMGVGASAGVSHTASGISVRTFTVPTPQVKSASLTALKRMGITVDAVDATATGEMIRASYAERSIEIELESMSKSTTQMRVTAKRNMFVYDTATAREIVEQTALSIGPADRRGKVASL
jgi:hypothetical protein